MSTWASVSLLKLFVSVKHRSFTMNWVAARMPLLFVCLLSSLLLSTEARSNSSAAKKPSPTTPLSTDTLEENSATVENVSKLPKSLRKRCEKHCLVEALQVNATRVKEDFCTRRCPSYKTPEEYLDPDAECTKCPDGACLRCRCDTGECISNTTASKGTSSESNEGAGDETADEGFIRAKFTGPVGGTPVESQYCASCRPRKKCRPFWFCRKKKSKRNF